jgi:hypothetical protein
VDTGSGGRQRVSEGDRGLRHAWNPFGDEGKIPVLMMRMRERGNARGPLMSTHQNGVPGGNAFISLSASLHASAAIGVNQAAQVLNLRVKTPPLALGSHLRPQTGHATQHALAPSLPTVCHFAGVTARR